MKIDKLDDTKLLTLCIYGEARNQGLDGMHAVGSVVRNRVEAQTFYGNSYNSVILLPQQFSCFNSDDPNLDKLKAIAQNFDYSLENLIILRRCHWIARGVIEGVLGSNVGGATLYLNPSGVKHMPAWVKQATYLTKVGDHEFYKERLNPKKKGGE